MRALLVVAMLFIWLSSNAAVDVKDDDKRDAGDQGVEKCSTQHFTSEATGAIHTIMRCGPSGPSERPTDDYGSTDSYPDQAKQQEGGDNLDVGETAIMTADEKTAEYTRRIWIWTAMGVVVGVFTLPFLAYTIWQNHRTFRHIQQTSIEESKPYFTLGPCRAQVDALRGANISSAVINLAFNNNGNSGAKFFKQPVINDLLIVRKCTDSGDILRAGYWKVFRREYVHCTEFLRYTPPRSTQHITFKARLEESKVLEPARSDTSGEYIFMNGFIFVRDISTTTSTVRRIDFYLRSRDWPDSVHGTFENIGIAGDYSENSNTLGKTPIELDNMIFTVVNDRIISKHEAENGVG